MTWNAAFIILGALALTPFMVYVCLKLGTYAIMAGRDRFLRDKETEKNGNKRT